ncbi:CubicO group peptidase (beta-lactamase class C family) [Parvibaculum indicum]|uniref:serine hydrolase domain-containing protein n=1 Tax=Parvibaculum indicum TaxID=562969 RepID=UPI001421EE9A|nr:serine hydrolase domain-containing protein [Parvibaculum indicum]NIJ41846.1 CubicO group peptidase (beta-lactamase class C family) [Parvibaculum indicum]
MSDSNTVDIQGNVAPGFEAVRDAFAANFTERGDVGASFAIWKDGDYLVDLWGGHSDAARTKPWQRDTLPNVWSTTKAVAALCLARLVERGELSYDDPMVRYWPEFGTHGKDRLTVGQAISHQAGLSTLREPLTAENLYDHDDMAARMAAAEPLWEPGTRSGYHALTYAFITGELVKRITGKTIGQFLRDEIAGPWEVDFFIGLPESEEPRIAEMIAAPNAQPLDAANLNDIQKLTFANPAPSATAPNERAWRAAEISSANGRGTASALAKLFGAVAAGGTLNGTTLVGKETLARMSAEQISNEDLVLGLQGSWGAGVLRNAGGILYGPNEPTIGHSGWGGSFVACDPVAGIGISYVMNQMGPDLAGDPRAMSLLAASYDAL